MRLSPDCDCGACCDECGHNPDCRASEADRTPQDGGFDRDAYEL